MGNAAGQYSHGLELLDFKHLVFHLLAVGNFLPEPAVDCHEFCRARFDHSLEILPVQIQFLLGLLAVGDVPGYALYEFFTVYRDNPRHKVYGRNASIRSEDEDVAGRQLAFFLQLPEHPL